MLGRQVGGRAVFMVPLGGWQWSGLGVLHGGVPRCSRYREGGGGGPEGSAILRIEAPQLRFRGWHCLLESLALDNALVGPGLCPPPAQRCGVHTTPSSIDLARGGGAARANNRFGEGWAAGDHNSRHCYHIFGKRTVVAGVLPNRPIAPPTPSTLSTSASSPHSSCAAPTPDRADPFSSRWTEAPASA